MEIAAIAFTHHGMGQWRPAGPNNHAGQDLSPLGGTGTSFTVFNVFLVDCLSTRGKMATSAGMGAEHACVFPAP